MALQQRVGVATGARGALSQCRLPRAPAPCWRRAEPRQAEGRPGPHRAASLLVLPFHVLSHRLAFGLRQHSGH
eukprot:7487177-Lingulodinium_polyedra.AAC.1